MQVFDVHGIDYFGLLIGITEKGSSVDMQSFDDNSAFVTTAVNVQVWTAHLRNYQYCEVRSHWYHIC